MNFIKKRGWKIKDFLVDRLGRSGTNLLSTSEVTSKDITIRRLLQDNVEKTSISSTKSATGHLLGAAGAIEAIYSILSIVNQVVPPTNNLVNPDSETLGFDLVPIHTKKRTVKNSPRNIKIFSTCMA